MEQAGSHRLVQGAVPGGMEGAAGGAGGGFGGEAGPLRRGAALRESGAGAPDSSAALAPAGDCRSSQWKKEDAPCSANKLSEVWLLS